LPSQPARCHIWAYSLVLVLVLVLVLCSASAPAAAANKQNLPTFGDASSGVVSLPQEREIGQDFLRSLRGQAPTIDDPILQDYVEYLTYKLVSNSELNDRRLDLVVIDSPVLNAFAVPGGVIGVHHGLFHHAETQHEVAAILAHEIAHLSQRHFARGVEAQQKSSLFNTAALLASVVLMTTVGGEVGLAALNTVQGVSLAKQLSHSRAQEAEADRVGIDTLTEADMDPRAMAYMFERLESASRYSADEMPEFLRSHPVTRSRIADSYNQTTTLEKKSFPLNIDFQLMKARVKAITATSPNDVLPAFRAGIDHEDPIIRNANRYGLVLALTASSKFDEAHLQLVPLLDAYPDKISLQITEANIHLQAERYEAAKMRLESSLAVNPGNYPLTMALARVLTHTDEAKRAQKLLSDMTINRKTDAYLWYHLAEAAGLAEDIIGVHWARAEYFLLTGNYEQALKQLNYAQPLVKRNFQQQAKIGQKIKEISNLQNKKR
jgi:predicted Zn-dependent protease